MRLLIRLCGLQFFCLFFHLTICQVQPKQSNRPCLNESDTPSTRTRDVEVTIDSSILDCAKCLRPLQLPLFQCINGHVACSECSRKSIDKCPTCSTTAISRCIPFESLIKSRKIKCMFAISRCPVSLPYDRIATHENQCRYAPRTCPIPDCNFICEEFWMSTHIRREHASYELQREFDYGQWYGILVEKEKPFILRSTTCMYMLLNRHVDVGYVLWIARLDERTPHKYELEVESVDGNLWTLKGLTQNAKDFFEEVSSDRFMCVPPNLWNSTGHLNVKIRMFSF